MFLVERKLPSKIIVLDALNRRAPSERIYNLLKRAEIGYLGERKVDTKWNEIALPQNTLLFHNYESPKHQIDTLLVCSHFIFVLEIKNVSGTIWYEEEKHQFLRQKKTGEIESFQSPIEQVKRHAEFMERLLERLGLIIPVHKAVVIADPSTIIGRVPIGIPIFHAIGLKSEVNKLLLNYPKPFVGDAHLKLLKDELNELYHPGIYQPKFEIPTIRKGAICICGQTMHYKQGKFNCPCGNRSKEALFQGLHDYRVLFSERISNMDFRKFFFIENQDIVNKLLVRLNLEHEGSNRGRHYKIPKNIWKNI